jgi:hypothetical protein
VEVEKIVHVPVAAEPNAAASAQDEAERKALQDYSESLNAQRALLGQELDKKAEEIERERSIREELEAKLAQLQGKCLPYLFPLCIFTCRRVVARMHNYPISRLSLLSLSFFLFLRVAE